MKNFLRNQLLVLICTSLSLPAFSQTAATPAAPAAQPVPVQKVKENHTESSKPEAKTESPKAPDRDRLKNSESHLFSSLDYPELQVVPRASDRLAMESPLEKDLGLSMFWPFQLSALMTVGTGFMMKGRLKEDATEQERKDADFAANAAVGIGAAWIGLTYYLLSTEPYGSELSKIKKYKGNDKRTDLLRERIAEEALQKPAELIRTLTWISFATNFGATVNLIDRSTKDNNLYPALGAVAAFLPLIFKNRYIENYEKHLEYKRKIYSPIVSTTFYPDKFTGALTPGLLMTWNF